MSLHVSKVFLICPDMYINKSSAPLFDFSSPPCAHLNHSKYRYIKQMYDVIYEDEMADARIAVRLADAVHMNRNGNIVRDDSCQVFGLPVDMELVCPKWLLFADETGCRWQDNAIAQNQDGTMNVESI